MFNRLVHANGLIAEFTKYKLDEKDMTFIREQIAGPSKTENRVCIFLSSNNIIEYSKHMRIIIRISAIINYT